MGLVGEFPRFVESGFQHQRNDGIVRLRSMLAWMDEASKKPMWSSKKSMWSVIPFREIDEVEGASGPEHAARLKQGELLRVRLEVMEHQRRQYLIEGPIGIGQLLREALIEVHSRPCAFGLSAGSDQCFWVRVHPNDLGRGLEPLGQD